MSKDLAIIALGVWVALMPFLGFPRLWDTIIFIISGLLIVLLMVLIRSEKRRSRDGNGVRENGVYVENSTPRNENSDTSSGVTTDNGNGS